MEENYILKRSFFSIIIFNYLNNFLDIIPIDKIIYLILKLYTLQKIKLGHIYKYIFSTFENEIIDIITLCILLIKY